MKPSVIDLMFSEPHQPLPSKEPLQRPKLLKGRKSLVENAGFKFSKGSMIRSGYSEENAPSSCHIHGISLSKSPYRNVSESSYLNSDSALIAHRILKEQEEIMDLFENSAFLTHSLSGMKGLTEHQSFIRAFEEVERAKCRLLSGPYPSRTFRDSEDEDLMSVDSLCLTPGRSVEMTSLLQQSIRENAYHEMHELLSSDDEGADDGFGIREGDDHLDDIQLELQRRIPSKLDFRKGNSLEIATPADGGRRDRYRDNDLEERSASLRHRHYQKEKVVRMMVDSLPEWLVHCVRSYDSVYNNDQEVAVESNGGEQVRELQRTARKYLQVERYFEKMERELSQQYAFNAQEGINSRRKMRHKDKLETEARTRIDQKHLMSRSTNSLVSKEAKKESQDRRVNDDEKIEYHFLSHSQGMKAEGYQVHSTLRKGRMLLLSAVMSFGDAVGQTIVNEALKGVNDG